MVQDNGLSRLPQSFQRGDGPNDSGKYSHVVQLCTDHIRVETNIGNINNCDAIAAFRNQLLSKLNERFNFIEEAKSLFIAMLLDPRIKDMLLSGDKKAWANTVLRSIALEYLDVSNASESNGRTGVPPNELSGECETIIRLCVTVFNVVCYILCLYDRIIASGKYPPIFMQHWKR